MKRDWRKKAGVVLVGLMAVAGMAKAEEGPDMKGPALKNERGMNRERRLERRSAPAWEGMENGMRRGGITGGMMFRRPMGDRARSGRLVGRLMRHQEELSLTENQMDQLHRLHTGMQKTRIQKRSETQVLAVDLREALHQNMPDVTKAKLLTTKINAAKLELQLAELDHVEKSYQVLTPEQREKLSSLPKRGERM